MRCHICGAPLNEFRHDDHEDGCSGDCCVCHLPACPTCCGVCKRPRHAPRRRIEAPVR